MTIKNVSIRCRQNSIKRCKLQMKMYFFFFYNNSKIFKSYYFTLFISFESLSTKFEDNWETTGRKIAENGSN